MINRGILNLILGGFFYTLIIFSFLTRYNNIVVYAKENILQTNVINTPVQTPIDNIGR